MGHTVLAIGIGLILGWLAGGRPRFLSDHHLRLWGLVVLGFAVANLRLVGMGLIALGLAANGLVIVVDHGMPVRGSAVVAAKVASEAKLHTLHFGAKHHLEKSGDHWMVLADIIPLPLPLSPAVLSFGDLVMDFGVADLLVHLLQKKRLRYASSQRLRAWSVARAPASSTEGPAATPWRASPGPVSATTTTP
jgi:hypothetical protein